MIKKLFTVKTIPIVFGIITFIFTFLINKNVNYYGDDYYYLTFSSSDFSRFLNSHITHYLKDNGRSIVHLLDSMFLSWDNHLWQIFNSFMLATIVFLGSKIITNNIKLKLQNNSAIFTSLFSCILMFASIAFLNIAITRQSAYWITGSFNYVYPLFMFILFWYLFLNIIKLKNFKFLLPILAFLSGATTEQSSMMVVGLIILSIIDIRFFKKEKCTKWYYISLVFAILGCLSVYLAPATFVRIGLENADKVPLLDLVKTNIKIQGYNFLFSNYMLPYNILVLITTGFCIFKLSSTLSKITLKLLRIFSFLSIIFIIALYLFVNFMQQPFGVLDNICMICISLYYSISLIITFLLVFKTKFYENYLIPIIAIILCFGSQLIMIVSPVYGPRNMLCGIIMLSIFIASILPICLNVRFDNNNARIKNAIILLFYACLLIVSIKYMSTTIIGYKTNADIDKTNAEYAREYKLHPTGNLTQFKLRLEDYGWSMPYYSRYHEYYYKMFIGVKEDIVIDWVDSK